MSFCSVHILLAILEGIRIGHESVYPKIFLETFPILHYPFYRWTIRAPVTQNVYTIQIKLISLHIRFHKSHVFYTWNIEYCWRLSMCSSIFLLIASSVERYLAVCRPHHYRQVGRGLQNFFLSDTATFWLLICPTKRVCFFFLMRQKNALFAF